MPRDVQVVLPLFLTMLLYVKDLLVHRLLSAWQRKAFVTPYQSNRSWPSDGRNRKRARLLRRRKSILHKIPRSRMNWHVDGPFPIGERGGRKHHCWGQNCHSSFDYKQALLFLLPFLSSLFSVSLDSPSFPSAMAASPPRSWSPLHSRCLGRWSQSQARNPILNLFPLYDPMIKQFLALILKKMFLVSVFPHWFGAIQIQFITQ